MPEFTERQAAAWPEVIADLQSRTPYHIPVDLWGWLIKYHEETRPGRGHAIEAAYLDGEIVATVHMDVYGYPMSAIATTEWIHSSDEFCECERCAAEEPEEWDDRDHEEAEG